MQRKTAAAPTRQVKLLRLGVTSTAFFLPIILAAAYLNAGQTCCNGPCPPPPPPDFTVSKNTAGVAADDESIDGYISGGGFDIAFSSFATNLDADTSIFPGPHIFIHNIITKNTTWVDLGAFGLMTDGATSPVLSSDGRFIAFEEEISSLGIDTIIFRDLGASPPGYEVIVAVPDPVSDPTMSFDGRYVAFATAAALLPEDTDTLSDVYMMDRNTGTPSFLSGPANDGQAATGPHLSGDAQTIAFELDRIPEAFLVTDVAGILFITFLAGDSPSLSDDGSLVAFRRGIFAPNAIYTHELLVGPPVEVSLDTSGNPSTDDCDYPVLSGDGRYVAFSCVMPMTNHGAANQVYVRDLLEGTTKLASLSVNGDPANSTDSKPVSMSSNGNAVIIESSASNLGSAPGGYPQVFRIPISYWEESDDTGCSSDDTTCDGADDDCDGQTDEDYVSQATNCGVGACAAIGATSCSGGQVVDSCVPGTPSAMDALCDGVDEDCDGTIDEDAVSEQTTCPLGGCLAVVTGPCGGPFDCVANGVCISETACADAADNDTDGLVDCWDSDCFASTDCANAAPILNPVGVQTVTAGEILRFTLSATDADGDPLSYGVSPLPLPANATLNGATGEFEFAPTLSQIASTAFEFSATDGRDVATQTTVITVIAPTPGGPTAVTGFLYDAVDAAAGNPPRPVVGATITDLANPGNSTVSDANGAFTLQALVPGQATIEFDGETAALPPQPVPTPPEPVVYGSYRAMMVVESGTTKQMSRPVFVPRIDGPEEEVVPGSMTILTNPTIPGVVVEIEADSVVDENGQTYTDTLRVSSVPPEFTPGALPDTLSPSTVLTIQPMGIRFTEPAAVTFPNDMGLAPGSEVDIWSLDHSTGEFFRAGGGVVSSDGSVINSNPGEGIVETSWHFGAASAPEDDEGLEGDGTGDGSSSDGGAEPSGGDGSGGDNGPDGSDGDDDDQPNTPDDDDPDQPPGPDPCADFASSMPLAKGKIHVNITLPSYKVVSEPFAHALTYDSQRAFPYYLLPINATVAPRRAKPLIVSYQTKVGGVSSNDTRYISMFLPWEPEAQFRIVPGVDATGIATSVVPVEVLMTGHFNSASFSTVAERQLPVINGRSSPFGVGWGWAGVRRLISNGFDSGRLLINGSGAYRVFRFADGEFVSPPGDDSSLVANGDGTHTLRRTDGVEIHFDTHGLQESMMFPNLIEWRYGYDQDGRLSSIVDPTGGTTIINYEGDFISEVIDPANRRTEFDHDNGDLIRVRFPDGSKREFGYDERHLMTSETNARDFTKYRDFDFAGRLTRVTLEDTSERQVTVAAIRGFIAPNSTIGLTKQDPAPYTPPDRVTTVEDAEGRTRSFEIGAYGKVTKVTDAAGLVTTFERDDDGNLLRVVRPSGQAFSMTYDDKKNLLTRTDEILNGTTVFTYEPVRDRVETRTDALDHVTQFEYDPSGNLKKVISPLLRELDMTYYADGNIETITDALSRVARYDYDANGNLETFTVTAGSESRITSFVNFGSGYPETITNPLPEQLTLVRDQWNRPTSLMDHAGQTTGFTYHPGGNLETVIPPSRPVHTFLYNARDRNTDYVPPELNGTDLRTTLDRNREGQIILVTLPDSRTISYGYDTAGRPETTTITGERTYTSEYDPNTGQLRSRTDPDGGTLSFAYQGARLRRVRSNGDKSVLYSYNPAGQVDNLAVVAPSALCDPNAVATWPADGSPADPAGGHDGVLNGDVTYVPGIEDQAFSLDGLGDWVEANIPVDGLTTLTFATWVRVTGLGTAAIAQMRAREPSTRESFFLAIDSGGFIRVGFDGGSSVTTPTGLWNDGEWHHVVAIKEPLQWSLYVDGAEEAVAPAANMPFETSGVLLIGRTTISASPSFKGDIDGFTVYDRAPSGAEIAQWHADQIAVPCGLDDVLGQVDFAYDPDGAVTQAGDVTMTYDLATGLLETVSLGDLAKTLTYNSFGEIESERTEFDPTQTVVHQVSYDVRDSLGRVSQRTETLQGVTVTYDYMYDDAGRLGEVLRDGPMLARYTYDVNGNRKTVETPTETITATYDEQDRLLMHGGNDYTYRDSGELLTKTNTVTSEQTTYDYDELGNLLSVSLSGSSLVEYETDALGRRVGRKVDGQVTHRWIYKDQLNPVAELDGDGNLVALFIYGTRPSVPNAMVKNGTRYLFVTDYVGSVRLVVDADTGTVVQRMDYDAWGNVLLDNNPGFQPFGFAGGLYDRDTKLVRFGARDYDPEVGRWTQKDPIGFAGGFTLLYSYVGSDPVNAADPSGLLGPLLGGAVLAGEASAGAALCYALTGAISAGAITYAVGGDVGDVALAAAGGLVGGLGTSLIRGSALGAAKIASSGLIITLGVNVGEDGVEGLIDVAEEEIVEGMCQLAARPPVDAICPAAGALGGAAAEHWRESTGSVPYQDFRRPEIGPRP